MVGKGQGAPAGRVPADSSEKRIWQTDSPWLQGPPSARQNPRRRAKGPGRAAEVTRIRHTWPVIEPGLAGRGAVNNYLGRGPGQLIVR